MEAVLPFERTEDFLTLQNHAGSCNFVKKAVKPQEKELKQPRYNSFKETRTYSCEYGPEDFSGGKQGSHQG